MSIEFDCIGCRHTLRVPAASAGKNARCPQCGTTVPIPPAGPDSAAASNPFSDPLPPTNPFKDSPSETTPFLADDASGRSAPSANPFAAPPPTIPRSPTLEPLSPGSVVALKVCAVFMILFSLGQFAISGFATYVILTEGLMDPAGDPAFQGGGDPAALQGYVIGQVIGIGLSYVVYAVVLFGAIQMLRLKRYWLGITATIVVMLPCNCPICVLGLPLGVWGLVLLSKPAMKAAFT